MNKGIGSILQSRHHTYFIRSAVISCLTYIRLFYCLYFRYTGGTSILRKKGCLAGSV
jgi:hypothetical protein